MDNLPINEIIDSLCLYGDIITEDMQLIDDLGFDSLNLVELIVALEDEFEIEIDEGDLDPQNLQTVKDIYDLVDKYIGEVDAV